jgi:phosphate transport system protein
LRATFEARIAGLEGQLLQMGQLVQTQLARALEVLARGDATLADTVITQDEAVNQAHDEIEQALLSAMSLQSESPQPGDLRLMAAVLHVNAHLERMGDLCGNIARLVRMTSGQPPAPEVQATLAEMGGHAQRLIAAALASFARRDLDLADSLSRLDDPLDRLNQQVFRQIERAADADPRVLGWATRMILVARYLERLGDHAVEVGEQAAFVVTGKMRGVGLGKSAQRQATV